MGKNISGADEAVRSGSNTALLIVDMISDFNFEDGEKLYPHALKAAERLKGLKARAQAAGVPVIYVNDNFGKWNVDFFSYVDDVRESSEKGRTIVELIGPEDGDYHILKPQRSAFYATPLGVLLLTLNVGKLVITGVSTDICILFTAHDAYMRGFELVVPEDCTAAVERHHHETALELLERVAYVDLSPSDGIEFPEQSVEEPKPTSKAVGQPEGSEF